MPDYSLLSIFVAIIAVAISAVSLIRTERLQRQQEALNEITEKLSRKQLDLISREESDKMKTKVVIELVKDIKNYSIALTNKGRAIAHNIEYEITCETDTIGNEEIIPIMQPGQTIKYYFPFDLSSPEKYSAKISWINPDETKDEDEFYLVI